jgi:ABC-type transport system involved in multi-copper enzyme maturation permease subunit
MKMEQEHTERTASSTIDASTTTTAACLAEPQWWQYLAELVVILVAWLIVGSVASLLVAFAFSGQLFTLAYLLNPEASVGGWLTAFLNYFFDQRLVWVVVSLVDGTTEPAIGAHFGNNIGFFLRVNPAGSIATTPALFSVSQYDATFLALAMFVIVSLFLAISYGVFKQEAPTHSEATDESVSKSVER